MVSGSSVRSDVSVAGAVLAGIRADQQAAQAAEASKLAGVLTWCELHVTEDPDRAATWGGAPVRLGGVGCPWVGEFTLTELAAGLGMSPTGARALVADVLELAFRLPRLWAAVQTGRVPAWRARRIAEQTQILTIEAAGFLDAQVAGFAARMGATAVDRLLAEAVARFMPDLAREQREQAADARRFDIDHARVSFAGTSRVEAELDLADALDLDAAIAALAEELKQLGADLGLDQRRALAAGELARRQLALHLNTTDTDTGTSTGTGTGTDTSTGTVEPEDTASTARPAQPARPVRPVRGRGRRDLTLYAHLSADPAPGALAGATVSLEGHHDPVITLDTLRDWLTIPADIHVTIRPIIDLNADLTSTTRFATGLHREQITLRDRTCTAPHCSRPARHLDLDHTTAWDDHGPPDQTRSTNLAALCRHHHRAKTLTSWTYQQLLPGVFLWHTPHGLRYLTTTGHTIDLN
ncbi:HNH endonuclease signature motif containing protein [Nocardioides terrisoli]|uniref:HNH endonuclease signature motif containing protein n=1 Tax=Nocardioides terrisoli TaxID=3388267 RepID=UPI00287BB366|nr:HNH endonuclease signature motif containing protein [Nocardioides marmorisolisilvae]